MGTFVLRSLARPSMANQAELRSDLVAWLRRAQAAGLTSEDVIALVDTTIRATLAEGLLQEEPT